MTILTPWNKSSTHYRSARRRVRDFQVTTSHINNSTGDLDEVGMFFDFYWTISGTF